MENWVKNLIPDDKVMSREVSQFIIARWGNPRKAIDQIAADIQKKEEEIQKKQSELMALRHRKEEMELEQQRQEELIGLEKVHEETK